MYELCVCAGCQLTGSIVDEVGQSFGNQGRRVQVMQERGGSFCAES